MVPRIAGNKIGKATYRQYWKVLAPRFSAASTHSRRRPSIAGAMINTMRGNWKYIYTILKPQNVYRVKP